MSISGKFSTAKISGANIRGVQRANASGRVQELDGTTAEDAGYENPDAGLRSMTVSLFLVIDITTGDLTTIQEGVEIQGLEIYADINAITPVREIPLFLVLEATYEGEVAGRVTYSVTGKSKGFYNNYDPN
jgi:hypothetical protein